MNKPQKIIFLDIDGVIRPFTFDDWGTDEFDRRLVRRVTTLVEGTGAKVVLSTAWRKFYKDAELRHKLERHGLPARHIIGQTPTRATRGWEIATWLHEYRRSARVAVIDDNDRGQFDMHPVRQHLVHTRADHGFTRDKLREARALLTDGPIWTPDSQRQAA